MRPIADLRWRGSDDEAGNLVKSGHVRALLIRLEQEEGCERIKIRFLGGKIKNARGSGLLGGPAKFMLRLLGLLLLMVSFTSTAAAQQHACAIPKLPLAFAFYYLW